MVITAPSTLSSKVKVTVDQRSKRPRLSKKFSLMAELTRSAEFIVDELQMCTAVSDRGVFKSRA